MSPQIESVIEVMLLVDVCHEPHWKIGVHATSRPSLAPDMFDFQSDIRGCDGAWFELQAATIPQISASHIFPVWHEVLDLPCFAAESVNAEVQPYHDRFVVQDHKQRL